MNIVPISNWQEEFEDTKGVIRFRIPKKNRQRNGQKKKYKLDDQTNVEFAREKELLFEKWLTSQEVTKLFNKLSYKLNFFLTKG
jgi:hypothetical protein